MHLDDTTAMLAYQARKKEVLVAYLLWFFLGPLGIHRIYSNRVTSGVVMLVLCIAWVPLFFVLIGIPMVFGLMIWWFVDAFLIPGWIQQHNELLIGEIQQARFATPAPPSLAGGGLPPVQ